MNLMPRQWAAKEAWAWASLCTQAALISMELRFPLGFPTPATPKKWPLRDLTVLNMEPRLRCHHNERMEIYEHLKVRENRIFLNLVSIYFGHLGLNNSRFFKYVRGQRFGRLKQYEGSNWEYQWTYKFQTSFRYNKVWNAKGFDIINKNYQ